MNPIDVAGRVAVVTGAGGGLGRSHALALAQHGARVVVNDHGSGLHGEVGQGPDPQRVVDEIRDLGGEAVANADTVADPSAARRIVGAALESYGRLDIVVNNAGVLRDSSLRNMTVEDIDLVLDVHLRGTMFISQAAFTNMKEQGFGRLVHTSSASGLYGNFGQANYSAAKAGIAGFSRTLAIEGAKYGVLSNTIAPFAATRMTAGLLGPLEGYVPPDQVSPLVVFLCSTGCTDSGDVYTVGGGRFARVVTGFGAGWTAAGPTTPEMVAEHWAAIRSLSNLTFPADTASEGAHLAREIGASD